MNCKTAFCASGGFISAELHPSNNSMLFIKFHHNSAFSSQWWVFVIWLVFYQRTCILESTLPSVEVELLAVPSQQWCTVCRQSHSTVNTSIIIWWLTIISNFSGIFQQLIMVCVCCKAAAVKVSHKLYWVIFVEWTMHWVWNFCECHRNGLFKVKWHTHRPHIMSHKSSNSISSTF